MSKCILTGRPSARQGHTCPTKSLSKKRRKHRKMHLKRVRGATVSPKIGCFRRPKSRVSTPRSDVAQLLLPVTVLLKEIVRDETKALAGTQHVLSQHDTCNFRNPCRSCSSLVWFRTRTGSFAEIPSSKPRFSSSTCTASAICCLCSAEISSPNMKSRIFRTSERVETRLAYG